MIPALALPIFNILPAEALPALLMVFTMALVVYFGLQMVRAEVQKNRPKRKKF